MVYNSFAELAQELGLDPNNPTYEGQQKLKDWLNTNQKSPENPDGYEVQGNTQRYLDAPTEPPQQEMPQDTVPTKTYPVSAPWNRQEGGGTDSLDQVDQAIEEANAQEEADKTAKRQRAVDWWAQQGRNLQTASEGIGEGASNIAKYIPMSAAVVGMNQMTGGVDRSGEAAGYESLAAQNQYQAAQNEKLRQANMQQAMDNTIADKMAAAEAESKWKQNARALGAEGGAQAVAAQNEAATPDLWKQKQLQNERRDVAAQNLAEVDKNKRQAIQNETKASMTNYNTRVNDNLNMRANALSIGGAEGTKKEDTETETKSEDTGTTETKTEDTGTKTEDTETQPIGTESEAVSNQESEGVQTATDKVAIDNIITQVNALNDKLKAGQAAPGMIGEYNDLKAKYDELKDKVDNPPAFPDMWLPSSDQTDVSNIASTIDDLTM